MSELQFLRSVFPHAREQHASGMATEDVGHRLKETGDRRPQPVLGGILAQHDAMAHAHLHVQPIRSHIRVAWHKVITCGGYVHRKAAGLRQPPGEPLNESGRHVLHNEHGDGEIFGQSGEEGLQHERAAS
jgi:hypothetical protein